MSEWRRKISWQRGHVDENLQNQMQSSSWTADMKLKQVPSLLYLFFILDCWHEANRSDLSPKLVFVDQLCEISPHLPRSSRWNSIIRSLYNQYYGNSSSLPLTLRL
ncbi:hypothetical protein SOVF_044230, partial [Spinacia oleracea]